MTAYLDGYSGYSGVPEDAAAEILEKLMTHQQISSDEVAQILKRYGVCGEPEALQIAYRKKVGQRLIASLRDPYGRCLPRIMRWMQMPGFLLERLPWKWMSMMKLPLILSRHMGKIPAMTGPSRSTRRTWIRTWKRLIRRHVRLTIVCRCCSGFHDIGGSADEII